MYRRDFLKIGGLVSIVLLIQVNPLSKMASNPMEAEAQGKLYRGTFDGKILVSTNGGRTWQLHSDFGSTFSIVGLVTNLFGQVQVQLEFVGHSFELVLMNNGTGWKTA